MQRNLSFGAIGTFAATILAILLIRYKPNPVLLIILPMWGLVIGVAVARVVSSKKKK